MGVLYAGWDIGKEIKGLYGISDKRNQTRGIGGTERILVAALEQRCWKKCWQCYEKTLDFVIDWSGQMIRLAEMKDLENVLSDIGNGNVWLLEAEGKSIGTVTIQNSAVYRLFVLPEYQSRGYGSRLMDFAETKIVSRVRLFG